MHRKPIVILSNKYKGFTIIHFIMERGLISTQIIGFSDEYFYALEWDIGDKVKAEASKGWFTVYTNVETSFIIGNIGLERVVGRYVAFHYYMYYLGV